MNAATILRAMLSKETWVTTGPVVAGGVLTNPTAQKILSVIEDMHDVLAGDLTLSGLRMRVESLSPAGSPLGDDLLAVIGQMEQADLMPPDEVDYIVRKFASKELVMRGLTFGVTHIDDADFDAGKVEEFLQKAQELRHGAKVELPSLHTAPPPGKDYRLGVTPLGFNEDLDCALGGGLANGELGVLLGSSGVGKTSLLWAAAVNAAQVGRKVLAVSLEIKESKCFGRIDSCLTGMDRNGLISNPLNAMKKRAAMPGEIWVKDSSSRGMQVAEIGALVHQLRKAGEHVDFLMVDYMELVEPRFFDAKNRRFNYGQVCVDLRRLAAELDIPVLTAWQTNRAGADKHVLSKTDVGEDWSIVKTSDIIIGLNQNEEENRNKRMRLNILKQRESTIRPIFYCLCDLDRMIVRKVDESDFEVEVKEVKDGVH